jgi:transposase
MERYTPSQVKRALSQEQLLLRLDQGEDFEELCQELGLSLSWSYLPQLRRRYHQGGATWEALMDHRHGHASKVSAECRAWLRQQKRENPALTQQELADRFGAEFHTSLSQRQVSQILRAEGVALPGGQREWTARARAERVERVGVFFLQAAAVQMGVLDTAVQVILEQRAAYQGRDRAICHHRPGTLTRYLVHLLWLPRFDLVRPYHLRWVRPGGLGLLAGGRSTLGYSTLEHFLGDLEALRVAAPLGDALARCYLQVWPPPTEGGYFYLDNRRKVRYSGYPIAAGKISASDRILGATTQLFVHDAAGHGLYMHSGPGDDHLTRTLLPVVEHFVTLVGRERVRSLVADQEMRSVALFRDLDAQRLGFVTIGRTPAAAQEATWAVEGLFLPYLRDPQTGGITHWVAHAHALLTDRPRGLAFAAEVSLVLDCRAGLPGRLIPILHNWRDPQVPVELPHQVYVGHWENQERAFRDMCACQNLDAHYGQKKVAVPHRSQERKYQAWQRQQQAQEKRVVTAQRKVQEYTERIQALEEEARRQQEETQAQVQALRRESRAASLPKQRERRLVQAERRAAQGRVQQVRWRERRRRLVAQQHSWQQKLAKGQDQLERLAAAAPEKEEPPFYDFDLEKDDLMTSLRMAGENSHRWVQEQYFVGTLLEKVDEGTMVRVIYNQPGRVQRQGPFLYVQLQGYRDPEVQVTVAQACRRVNQAQIELPSGHRLQMEVAAEILEF